VNCNVHETLTLNNESRHGDNPETISALLKRIPVEALETLEKLFLYNYTGCAARNLTPHIGR